MDVDLLRDVEAAFGVLCTTTLKQIETEAKEFTGMFENAVLEPHVLLVELLTKHIAPAFGKSPESIPLCQLVEEVSSMEHIAEEHRRGARLLQEPLLASWKAYTDVLASPAIYDRYFASLERGTPGALQQAINSVTILNAFTHPLLRTAFSRPNSAVYDDLQMLRNAGLSLQKKAVFAQQQQQQQQSRKRKIDDITVYDASWKDASDHIQQREAKAVIQSLPMQAALICQLPQQAEQDGVGDGHRVQLSQPEAKLKDTVLLLAKQVPAFTESVKKVVMSDATSSCEEARRCIINWLNNWAGFLEETEADEDDAVDSACIQARRDKQRKELKQMWLSLVKLDDMNAEEVRKFQKRDQWLDELIPRYRPKLVQATVEHLRLQQHRAIEQELKSIQIALAELKMPNTDPVMKSIESTLTLVVQSPSSTSASLEYTEMLTKLGERVAQIDFVNFAFGLLGLDVFKDAKNLLFLINDKRSQSIPMAAFDSSLFKACTVAHDLIRSAREEAVLILHGKCDPLYTGMNELSKQLNVLVKEMEAEHRAASFVDTSKFLQSLRMQVKVVTSLALTVPNVVRVKKPPHSELTRLTTRWSKCLYQVAADSSLLAVEARAMQHTCFEALRRCANTSNKTPATFADCALVYLYMLGSCVALNRILNGKV